MVKTSETGEGNPSQTLKMLWPTSGPHKTKCWQLIDLDEMMY